ncbi:uncharacterized protein LOC141892995 [Acropora palmata]|uniref:uncharacterized protein LOC141892995 n=1 Tax=Acropora palmata TaxID=6131 RepID=UPI003D9FF8B3
MRKLQFIIFFQVLLGFSVIYDAESQLVTITSQPASPLRVLERQPLTLEWTFSVVRTILRVEVAVRGSRLAFVEASPSSIVIRGNFRGRVSAGITQTNATITIFSLNRTDTAKYVFAVIDTDGDFADAPLQLIVQYPPSLIARALDQVVLQSI